MPTTNAAALLADVITTWTVDSGQYPEKVRGFRSGTDLDAWRRNNTAVELLRVVDNLMQGMAAAGEDVSMFDDSVAHWYAAVHFAAVPWGNTQTGGHPRPTCPPTHLSLLRAFGAIINGWQPVVLDEVDRRALSDVLAEAEALVEEDSQGLPSDVRFYLWSLIARARKVVDHMDEYGAETAREVSVELGGAMIVHAAHVRTAGDDAKANRWQAAAVMLMSGFMGKFGGDGGSLAIEGIKHAAKQIGS